MKWLVETVDSKLVENQLKIILLIREKPEITIKELSEILKISTTAIDKNIQKFKFNQAHRSGQRRLLGCK